ncbi:uncharacterized protein LOC133201718 [Saccostrea echinata]|uniref:uncharacterized protein LOC133201718 n=1 Tax=Saccostrea echinata TaxID=191078 RepID=UPI002A808713|nr:uncharacterized protein LOC133201718 [Saccostrea echinata]
MDKTCRNSFIILYAAVKWLLEVVDLGLDWDFYIEVQHTDQQSIIRAVKLKWAILGFAIFGTVMFFSTLIAFCIKIYKKRKQKNLSKSYQDVKKAVSIMSLICTWFEDFPQIVLAVIVAVKSTELISIIQLVKAWYALAEATLQATIIFIELRLCCLKKPDYWKRVLLILELIGITLIFLVSIFLLIELYQDNFKEIYQLENAAMNSTSKVNFTTWSTPINST